VGHVNPGSDFRKSGHLVVDRSLILSIGQVRPHISRRAVKAQEANRTMHSDAVHFATPHGPPMASGLKSCDTLVSLV
jgi:hypothetical protein